MATEKTDVELREELRLVEEELTELRATGSELRRQIGERSDGSIDAADVAAAITAAEEQEAFLKVLEARRDSLRRRLGEE